MNFHFMFCLNNYKKYEISNELDHKIINLSTIMHDQIDVSSICDILKHLVKYQLIKALANNIPADALTESFKIQITSRFEEVFDPECVVELEQDEQVKSMLESQVKNKGSKDFFTSTFMIWVLLGQQRNICRGSFRKSFLL